MQVIHQANAELRVERDKEPGRGAEFDDRTTSEADNIIKVHQRHGRAWAQVRGKLPGMAGSCMGVFDFPHR